MNKKKNTFKLLQHKKLLFTYLVTGLIFSVISVVGPSISGDLVNVVIYRHGDSKVYLLLLILTYLLLLVFSVADQYLFQLFQIKEKKAMRNELFAAFLKRKGQDSEQIAAVSSFVNNDVPNIVENYYGGMVDILKCLCIIACVALKLLEIHWLLALIIIGSSVFIVTIPNIMRNYASKNRKNFGEALERYNGAQQSLLGGADTIKVCRYENHAKNIIRQKNEDIEREEKRLRKCQVSVFGIAGGMQIVKRFLILAVGVYLIYADVIKVGGLLVAVQLAEVLASPAEMLAYLLNAKNEAEPLVEKYAVWKGTEEEKGHRETGEIQTISVAHLSYARNGVKIINDFSGTFEKGTKYMLTGPSGCGKSTFLRLLAGLQEGTYKGEIKINGTPLKEINAASLYENIGVVFQEPYLFGFSLKENIIMGREVSDSDYEAVMKKLNLGYLLERCSDSWLDAQMAAKLSGGEKQRIALARAMVGKPQVYLLDEITSALDEQNAYEIEKILLAEDATILYVCHKIIPGLKKNYEVVAF